MVLSASLTAAIKLGLHLTPLTHSTMDGVGYVEPSKCPIGPPPPRYFAYITRTCMAALTGVICRWVQVVLGGVGLSPVETQAGANDTSHLFNLHPILMTLGFGVLMAEALLAYRAPLLLWLTRPQRKVVHFSCHCAALLCIVLGVVCAWQSHALKRPTPIPHLYSPHSFLGALTLALMALQFGVGLWAYLWPGWTLPHKLALSPLHRFGGCATWLLGLATMAVGIQEKTTFVQTGRALSGAALFGSALRLPAVAELLIGLLALLVLVHYAPPAQAQGQNAAAVGNESRSRSHSLSQGQREEDGEDGLVGIEGLSGSQGVVLGQEVPALRQPLLRGPGGSRHTSASGVAETQGQEATRFGQGWQVGRK